MSLQFQAVGWNRPKRVYDTVLLAFVAAWLGIFITTGAWVHPNATAETLMIRALGTCAIFLLHVILAIGPLCRLNPAFLPLLYNRRHLGVTMFLLGLAHGVFTLVQFHAFGDAGILESLFTSNPGFPFEVLGFLALCWLFLMAATSHDFWLETLSPRVWKALHMGVYVAYGLLVGHVPWIAPGAAGLCALHLTAAWRERRIDNSVPVCRASAIPDNRAQVVSLGGERIAVFRYGDKISAVSNVCRHQNGPLGEGRIIDGCITCPWHGYQYLPQDGTSPPPFPEKVETYATRVVDDVVYVDPRPNAPGTYVEPSRCA